MTLCLTRMRVHLERRTVAVRPRGRERQNPLPVVLLRCQRRFLSPSLSLAFVAENLRGAFTMEAAWRCLWHLRDYVFASRRYSRSLARLASSALVILSSRSHVWIFTEPKLRGEERRVQTSGAFAHNASIKVKRRTYVQRTSPSCNSSTVTRTKETIKNVLAQNEHSFVCI